mgnify:CR=1 FL=1
MTLLLMKLSKRALPTPLPPQDELRRSIRQRSPSSRYNPNEYVLLIDGKELESYS